MTNTLQQTNTMKYMAQPTHDQLQESIQVLQQMAELGYDEYLQRCKDRINNNKVNLAIFRFYAAKKQDKDEIYSLTKQLFETEILEKIKEDKQKTRELYKTTDINDLQKRANNNSNDLVIVWTKYYTNDKTNDLGNPVVHKVMYIAEQVYVPKLQKNVYKDLIQ